MGHVKSLAVFNNKGGVGKSTLTFHLAHALKELKKKVLLVDLDPQCNLTLYGLEMEQIHKIWEAEDPFITSPGFAESRKRITEGDFDKLNGSPRTVHYLLKPIEEGTGDLKTLPPPHKLANGLDVLPGRLTLHMYEEKVASRWSDIYRGDPLAIRTATGIRNLIEQYATIHSYDFALIDTSPSLGSLNKVAISTVDAFLVPCLPDVFSLYGVRNIGASLADWSNQFQIIQRLLSDEKRGLFPTEFVKFLGFTIFNARKYTGSTPWDLAQAHYNYAQQIPATIEEFIPTSTRADLPAALLKEPVGGMAVMHSHNTLPTMAQKYKCPIWEVPTHVPLELDDQGTIGGNRKQYEATRGRYLEFAEALLERVQAVFGGGT